jgi:hypothetical protein
VFRLLAEVLAQFILGTQYKKPVKTFHNRRKALFEQTFHLAKRAKFGG